MMLRFDVRPALLTAAAMISMLVAHPDAWVAKWAGLSTYLRVSLLILCPVFVAVGAWEAGRDRRSQLEELLASTPRPSWHPLLVTWASVTVSGLAGLAVPLAVAAALVGPRAAYAGAGWWWTALVGVIALLPASALGMLIGRLTPLRVVAPVAGLLVYLGLAVPVYLERTPWSGLTPVIGYASPEDVWPIGYHAWQAGWLIALAAVLLLLAARHWLAAGLPALLAVVLLAVPAWAGEDFGEPHTDPRATELVCTGKVCVTRVNAFMLEDVAAVLSPGLARLAEVPGAPVRAVDELARERGDDRTDVLWFNLNGQATLTGGVARTDWLLSSLRSPFLLLNCPLDVGSHPAIFAAESWTRGEPTAEVAALDEAGQRRWVGAVLAATRACDEPALDRLAHP